MPKPNQKQIEKLKRDLADGLERTIERGAACYVRNFNLAAMLGMSEEAVDKAEAEAPGYIVRRLRKALATEENRRLVGHWTADQNRWISIQQALRAEERILSEHNREAA